MQKLQPFNLVHTVLQYKDSCSSLPHCTPLQRQLQLFSTLYSITKIAVLFTTLYSITRIQLQLFAQSEIPLSFNGIDKVACSRSTTERAIYGKQWICFSNSGSAHFHVSWLSDFIFYHKPYINRFTNHFSIHS